MVILWDLRAYKPYGTVGREKVFNARKIPPSPESWPLQSIAPIHIIHRQILIATMKIVLLAGVLSCALSVSATTTPVVYNPGNRYPYMGCFQDLISSVRTLSVKKADSSSSTPLGCIQSCASSGYLYAGVEDKV
jgi:WSC domain